MTKTINTFRKDLRMLKIGESFEYASKLHKGYLATASYLKCKMNEGEWHCGKEKRILDDNGVKRKVDVYKATRIS